MSAKSTRRKKMDKAAAKAARRGGRHRVPRRPLRNCVRAERPPAAPRPSTTNCTASSRLPGLRTASSPSPFSCLWLRAFGCIWPTRNSSGREHRHHAVFPRDVHRVVCLAPSGKEAHERARAGRRHRRVIPARGWPASNGRGLLAESNARAWLSRGVMPASC